MADYDVGPKGICLHAMVILLAYPSHPGWPNRACMQDHPIPPGSHALMT
ncbi:hypothetical protein SXCC_00739 [Gluconacetobacter sp. SXCC-1]|nr:hypothetical protein SXCC_00739 [Gluconacetobacter sp. SXCC-1]